MRILPVTPFPDGKMAALKSLPQYYVPEGNRASETDSSQDGNARLGRHHARCCAPRRRDNADRDPSAGCRSVGWTSGADPSACRFDRSGTIPLTDPL